MAYSRGAVERAMKVQEVILRAIDGKLISVLTERERAPPWPTSVTFAMDSFRKLPVQWTTTRPLTNPACSQGVELDAGVEGERVWMTCTCGARIDKPVHLPDPPHAAHSMRGHRL